MLRSVVAVSPERVGLGKPGTRNFKTVSEGTRSMYLVSAHVVSSRSMIDALTSLRILSLFDILNNILQRLVCPDERFHVLPTNSVAPASSELVGDECTKP